MTYKDLPIVSETELIFARAHTRDWLRAVKKEGAGGLDSLTGVSLQSSESLAC